MGEGGCLGVGEGGCLGVGEGGCLGVGEGGCLGVGEGGCLGVGEGAVLGASGSGASCLSDVSLSKMALTRFFFICGHRTITIFRECN